MSDTQEVSRVDSAISQAIATYSVTDAAISELAAKYMPLSISGVEDRSGRKLVKAARLDVKRLRIQVEHTRKDLKAEALKYGKAVDGEANRIKGLLAPIENHLVGQESAVQAELDRIAREEEEARQRKLEDRMAQLAEVENFLTPAIVAPLSDEDFAEVLCGAREELRKDREAMAAKEQETRERLAREAEERAVEQAKLERAREDLEQAKAKVLLEQAEARSRIQAEQAQVTRERSELQRQAEAQAAGQRAELAAEQELVRAEKAKLQAEQEVRDKAQADADALAQAEDARAQEEARKAALAPDLEKLASYVGLIEASRLPQLADERSMLALSGARSEYVNSIRAIAMRLAR